MQEDHQKILSCEVLKQCMRYPIIKEIKYFGLFGVVPIVHKDSFQRL